MGIDVYLRWKGQTKEEEKAQYTGFNPHKGNVGYLREAYHGGPYATKILAPECWREENKVAIKAEELRKRLPAVLEAARARSLAVYKEEVSQATLKSFEDFVVLAEQKEKETGQPCTVLASY